MKLTHVSQVDEKATVTTELVGESAVQVTMANHWRVTVNEQGVFIDDAGGEEINAYRWLDEED